MCQAPVCFRKMASPKYTGAIVFQAFLADPSSH
jgi:hypothetical protein